MTNTSKSAATAQDDHPWPARRRWMAVLARATSADLESLLSGVDLPPYTVLRGPEDGLVMVRGRAGGGGAVCGR